MKVTAEDVQNWISRGEPVVLLDAAHPDAFMVTGKGTDGVRRLRPEEVAGLQRTLPKDTRFVAYASNAADDQPATLLANLLRQQGYPDVTTLAGGSEGWRRLGLSARADGSVRFPSVW
jgi:rhodanese-related sulfurtransferase